MSDDSIFAKIPTSIWIHILLNIRIDIHITIRFTRSIKICIIVSVHELCLNFKL